MQPLTAVKAVNELALPQLGNVPVKRLKLCAISMLVRQECIDNIIHVGLTIIGWNKLVKESASAGACGPNASSNQHIGTIFAAGRLRCVHTRHVDNL